MRLMPGGYFGLWKFAYIDMDFFACNLKSSMAKKSQFWMLVLLEDLLKSPFRKQVVLVHQRKD